MSPLNDVDGIPTAGKNLIVVAAVTYVLHFRIFDGDGKLAVDTDEKRLTKQARQIVDLRKQLEGLWPPHEMTRSDKVRIATAVTSIVGHTPPIYVFPCPNRCLRSIIFGQRFPQNKPKLVAAVREHLNQTSTKDVALWQARVDRAEYCLRLEQITRDQVGENVALPKLARESWATG